MNEQISLHWFPSDIVGSYMEVLTQTFDPANLNINTAEYSYHSEIHKGYGTYRNYHSESVKKKQLISIYL